MSTIVHAVFGEVTFDADDDRNRWDTTAEHAGRTVQVDVTFDGATVGAGRLDAVARFVTDVARFDALARQGMRDDAAAVIGDYLDFDGADDLMQEVFGTAVDADTFLAPMRLVRIGLYPDQPDACAVFDYTLGRELTDHLVAVTFDGQGTVAVVAVES